MGTSRHDRELLAMVMQTIAKYYPEGCSSNDEFQQSREWKQQQFLRDEALPIHRDRITRIVAILRGFLPPAQIDDNSSPSLYPCYNFRVLLQPATGWPDQRQWNWDVQMIRKLGKAAWVDLFFSYLGPYFAVVSTEFTLKKKAILVRRKPVEKLADLELKPGNLLAAFEGEWRRIPYRILESVVPGFATDTGGLGENTVFTLLFSDTFPAPNRWNGRWESLDPSPETPFLATDCAEDTPVGHLIPEATQRNELGTLPDLTEISSKPKRH